MAMANEDERQAMIAAHQQQNIIINKKYNTLTAAYTNLFLLTFSSSAEGRRVTVATGCPAVTPARVPVVADLAGPAISVSGDPSGFNPFSHKPLLADGLASVGERTASSPIPAAPSAPPSVDDEGSTKRIAVDFLAVAVGACAWSVLAPTTVLASALVVLPSDGTAVPFLPPALPSRLGSAALSVDGIRAGLGLIVAWTMLPRRMVLVLRWAVQYWSLSARCSIWHLADRRDSWRINLSCKSSTHSTLRATSRVHGC